LPGLAGTCCTQRARKGQRRQIHGSSGGVSAAPDRAHDRGAGRFWHPTRATRGENRWVNSSDLTRKQSFWGARRPRRRFNSSAAQCPLLRSVEPFRVPSSPSWPWTLGERGAGERLAPVDATISITGRSRCRESRMAIAGIGNVFAKSRPGGVLKPQGAPVLVTAPDAHP
jgi:hypothetical protein